MSDKLFYKLWKDALKQPDKEIYIGEYGYPEWFDEISPDASNVIRILENIHDVAHMSVREMIQKSGMSQAAFACHFCIPLRTVEKWATDERSCTDYLRLMFAKSLKILCITE